jgi:hypothetical protein
LATSFFVAQSEMRGQSARIVRGITDSNPPPPLSSPPAHSGSSS